jgi:hypothetical protein
MIKITDLKNRHLYLLEGWSFAYGIWDAGYDCFYGLKFETGGYHLDHEFHWDTHPRYGTAKPEQDLGPIPEHLGTVDLDFRGWFEYLTTVDQSYKPVREEMSSD